MGLNHSAQYFVVVMGFDTREEGLRHWVLKGAKVMNKDMRKSALLRHYDCMEVAYMTGVVNCVFSAWWVVSKKGILDKTLTYQTTSISICIKRGY